MERRTFLATAVGTVAALSGCSTLGSSNGGPTSSEAGSTPDGGGPTPDEGSGSSTESERSSYPQSELHLEDPSKIPEKPAKPDPLTAKSAVEYVEPIQLDEGYMKVALSEVESVSLRCKTFLHRETERGYVVLSGCGGYASGGSQTVDTSGEPVFYYVSPDRTVRIGDPDTVRGSRVDTYESGELLPTATGFRLNNFSITSTTFVVTVTHRENGETAYEGSFSVPAESGLVVPEVTRSRGTYDLEVTASGSTATAEWSVDGRRYSSYEPVTATLSPGPDLAVKRSEIGEIVSLGPV